MKQFKLFCLVSVLAFSAWARAESFVVSDIRIEGLQRVSAGTLFSAFPVNIGDTLDEQRVVEATRSLFATGFFNDIRIGRDGQVLVITVQERPSISSIQIEGNKAIETEALLTGLEDAGMSEGEIFKRATLDGMQQELTRQYVSQGRYGVEVETDVERLPRNRIGLSINVTEGAASKIKHINIVGNSVYSDDDLLKVFELTTTNIASFFRNDDKYAKEKLEGDLERLKSKYLDSGYINFNVESTQVSVTPDKKQVYITINVVEGDLYTVDEVRLAGDLILEEEFLNNFLLMRSGDVFSNVAMTKTAEYITDLLGNEGYTFANVNGIPEINEEEKTVDITVFVDPGKRAYVRRITFKGNTGTSDEVLRREMRQMESSWASNHSIELSKVRLERLGFFKEVNVETPPVPGTDDQIDVEYTVEEQPSGSISASVGFSQGQGLVLGGNLSQNNFMGSGNSVSININQSDFRTVYSFSFLNPYHTVDGVRRGFNLFFRELDFAQNNISSFLSDSFGGGVTFGYPLSETQSINFGFSYENTDITEGVFPAREISAFLAEEGDQYDEFLFTSSWRQSSLNRGVFATRGSSQTLSLEASIPGSDLTYFKLRYQAEKYFPLTRSLTFKLRTELGYGDAYGDTGSLPFFKHFFLGGVDSVRGFENNSLGPRETRSSIDPADDINPNIDPNAIGGNVLVTGSAEILFPLPFIEDQRSFQTALFFDVGNVFNSNCASLPSTRLGTNVESPYCLDLDVSDLRYSAGIGVKWLSGFGPISFSIAKPFNEGQFDETESFQFSFGQSF